MLPFTNSNPHPQLSQYHLLLFTLLAILALSSADPATMIVTVTGTPTSPSSPSYLDQSEFKNAILSMTNVYRTEHSAVSLIWNDTLTSYAKDWAKQCIWKHSNGPYGENLAYGYANASAAVIAWADEALKYNYLTPTGFTEETGHFTQLVWKATTEVGCACVDCGYNDNKNNNNNVPKDGSSSQNRAQGWYVVCEYMPAGNVIGRNNALFLDNVQAPVPKLPLGTGGGGGSKQNEGDKLVGGSGTGGDGMLPHHSRLSKTTAVGTATLTPSPSPTRMASAAVAAAGNGSGKGSAGWLALLGLVMVVYG